ncbi:MAG: GNAT family N-acetyltransferase [Aliishimia sp.]
MTVTLYAARVMDAGDVGEILSEAIDAAPWLPRLHTRAEDIAFASQMIDSGWVTIAKDAQDTTVGFLTLRGDEILSLYVAPHVQGQGIGPVFLDAAKAHCSRLRLWTYAQNHGAVRFYLREGFTEVERTDGSDNEANLPDICFEWERT